MLWLIHKEPKSGVLGALPAPVRGLSPYGDPDGYVEGKRAFLAHLEKESNDMTLLEYTADFLSLRDRSLAIELLKRGQSLDSSNPKWALSLAFKYYLGIRGRSGEPNVEAERARTGLYGGSRAIGFPTVIPRTGPFGSSGPRGAGLPCRNGGTV